MWTRRKFIVDSSLVVSSTLLPMSAIGGKKKTKHEEIADIVKAKWGKKGKVLTLFYPKGSMGNVEPVVKNFYKHTGVKVKMVEASLDQISGEMILKNQLSGGNNYYDVALPATFGIPDLVEASAVADLSGYAAKYDNDKSIHDSLYTLGNSFRGKLYGYQADGDAYLMFYNKPWLENKRNRKAFGDKFGTKLEAPKTWEELDRQIRFFHNPKQNRFGGSLYRNKNYMAWEFWMRFHSKGYFPLKDDLTPQIDNAAGVQVLEELIATTKYLCPDVAKNGLFENFSSYGKGNKYCNIGWGGTQKYLNSDKSKLKGKLQFTPAPGGKLKGQKFYLPYFNWGWNYVVSSKSKQKELSYLFTLYASTPFISTLSVREASGYFDPFRDEHYQDKKINEIYSKDFLSAHKQSLKESIPDFYMRGQGLYMASLKQSVFAASRGEISAKRALKEVATRWKELHTEMGEKTQLDQWSFLKKSYPKKLRGLFS